ncbi:hypothetical protein LTS14_006172 [Recurvomyces mirabilis]|uniref:uncharacterized protein n=1 Tax=Recurvomyces mirabilis TaxID=574656 RepID=UPI002DE05F1F|nr:hypothetical protein LTS14_006172 [Recurvomyces mirabilis]
MPVIVLNINQGSDGDGRRRPKTDDYTRNDDHWLDRMGEVWAKHQHIAQPGNTYRLDRLPDGYGGYERRRGDSKHVDRYVHGHIRGPARSVPDFTEHFLHLMDYGNAVACTCKLCYGGSRSTNKMISGAQSVAGTHFPQPKKSVGRPPNAKPVPYQYPHDQQPPPQIRQRQVDEEGTPDALRQLLDKLKAAGEEGKVDERIIESMSPDWRAGHSMLMQSLKECAELPGYMPRAGELVLFVRNLSVDDSLGWDEAKRTWRVINGGVWAETPLWEAGVVAQLPTEPISARDLLGVPEDKQKSVIEAGFRIEPMSQPNSMTKTLTKQHKYVHLHAIRPLASWKDCMGSLAEADWHATVRNALMAVSSFCVLGRYHFKGAWPEATIFAHGIYIGAELLCIGDTVRLQHKGPQPDIASEVMIITAIKIRIVNLDEANDDDQDSGLPYATCTHVSGRAFTRDPRRSFDGIGKVPIPQDSPNLPAPLTGSGTWYHISDPKKSKARLEVPFQRVAGRWFESVATKAWYTPPKNAAPPSAFQAVNARPAIKVNDNDMPSDVSFSLAEILEARTFSQNHDSRIDRANGKTWFWADTRVQQLDLHEINGTYVGVKDDTRSKEQMSDWRKALKALDGRQGGIEEYHAAREQRELAQAKRKSELAASESGLVAGGVQTMGEQSSGGDEDETQEDEIDEAAGGEAMEVDVIVPVAPAARMDIDDDDEDSESAGDALAAFKAAPTARKIPEVIELDDDDD